MALFAIADLHLSQSVNKPMDVFGPRWRDHVARLCANWSAVVGPEDWVVVPGDVSWGMNLEQARADFALIHSLPGRKIIGKGNHDYWWSTLKKLGDFTAANGFHSIHFLHNNSYAVGDRIVCGTRGWFVPPADEPDPLGQGESEQNTDLVLLREKQRLEVSIRHGRERAAPGQEIVVFLHYPPVYADYVNEKIMEVLVTEDIRTCYYGHIHAWSQKKIVERYMGVDFYLVAADYLGFMPLRIE